MKTARASFTGTLLPSGNVLVAGGENAGTIRIATAELYNPSTGKWTSTGSLHTGRFSQTATLLHDGQVLIAAGNLSPTAELYDPTSGTFSVTASLPTSVQNSAAVLLGDGAVLLPGGYNSSGQEGLAWLNIAVLYH
jgi:Galactose oxidase, central domain